jgi:hypothetical protein
VVAECDHLRKLKFSKTLPHAFTEHGAVMAASVLNMPRAVEVSVFIVRAFVKLREAVAGHEELARKLWTRFEQRLAEHDSQILSLVAAIKEFVSPATIPKRRRIAFQDAEP